MFPKQAANSLVTETLQYFVLFCRSDYHAILVKCLIINDLRLIRTILFFIAFLNITYTARHTYASRLYHADVPLPLIAQNMGRNPAEIETYLKEFDTDKIISANKRIWQIPRTEPLEMNTGGL